MRSFLNINLVQYFTTFSFLLLLLWMTGLSIIMSNQGHDRPDHPICLGFEMEIWEIVLWSHRLRTCAALFTSSVSAHFPCSQPQSRYKEWIRWVQDIESLLVLQSSLHLLSLLMYSSRRSTDQKWKITSPIAWILDQNNNICSKSCLWLATSLSCASFLLPCILMFYLPGEYVGQDSDLPILVISSVVQTQC